MAKQIINVGSLANDKTGDALRTAFGKTNANFTELYDATPDLGNFKIQGNTLGTIDDGNTWGGSSMNISPNGEGYTWIGIPNDSAATSGASLQIGNTSPTGGGIQLITDSGYWNFNNDGSLQLPADGTIKDYSGNILVSSSTFVDLPNWLMAVAGTAHLPTINSDYGWDSNGVWFTNATAGGGPSEGVSYPVRLTDSIPASQGVVITVEFDANPTSNDFGIGVWETGTDPVWSWGPASGNNRIGAQYNGTTPELYAIAGTGVAEEGRYNLPAAGTYKARLTISAPADGAITVTLETLDLSDTVLDTISYEEQPFSSSYSIGFAADQDNGTDKTYIKNLSVNINNGGTTYTDTLLSYNSVGTTGTGHFSFADNTVTITGQDMQFTTTRDGWDIDCDFDVNAADDVFIEALGDDVGILAANDVIITTSTLNMYPTTWLGQEENFLGTWDGTSLTLFVPNSEITLITLLTEYVSVSNPIWLKTASGYTKTDTNGNATKTVGDTTTTFEMSLSVTSPVADADIINMKVYDSINNGIDNEFTFTKSGKLQFPNGGMIEPVGMGWIGLTNGTSGNPVSVMAKNDVGTPRSELNLYNSGTYGTAQIYTSFAPGTPDAITYTVGNSTGSWDTNPVSSLNTTGGSGIGLTVDVYQSGSGYAESVTVVNPGNGYVDGETITVTSGESSATFTIAVSNYNHEWAFSELGATTLPGSIKGRVQGNTYTDTTIELDVNATINKLTPQPQGSSAHYHLADGVEGQIMYIAMATGGEISAEYTTMGFSHARYMSTNLGQVVEATDLIWWMPFAGAVSGFTAATSLTLIFIDGHWTLPHNWFD